MSGITTKDAGSDRVAVPAMGDVHQGPGSGPAGELVREAAEIERTQQCQQDRPLAEDRTPNSRSAARHTPPSVRLLWAIATALNPPSTCSRQ
ncbi:hypothetical protein DM194_16380 (plasmid) [Azospirillum ramasamyi]|uniref:Uncharacterized protein n=1 Tax=Azospirillum ramasamyi TaxID=682998 RepID=A0A2U9SB86_9PROT|nr:hypothetical protein DM194_16380 [Azospirillum ramasamyi]